MAHDLAKRKQGQGKAGDKGEGPPRPRRIPITIDGEVPLAEAASGRAPQPGPPRPDGSYTPHGLREGFAPEEPVDIAAWKQADYRKLQSVKAEENGHQSPTSRSTTCRPGKMIGGALLIAFTDFGVAIPLHIAMFAPAFIPGAEPLTPLAVKAVEALDLTVVLPATLLGIKLIADSKCFSK